MIFYPKDKIYESFSKLKFYFIVWTIKPFIFLKTHTVALQRPEK